MKNINKKISTYLDSNEYETFKTYSKKSGVSMSQLIKNYISTIDETKQGNNDITEQLNLISNLVNSPRFNIDSTAIENQLKESSKNTLSNLLDTFDLFKDGFNDNQNEVKKTVDNNTGALIEIINKQNVMIERNFKAILYTLSFLAFNADGFEGKATLNKLNQNRSLIKNLINVLMLTSNDDV